MPLWGSPRSGEYTYPQSLHRYRVMSAFPFPRAVFPTGFFFAAGPFFRDADFFTGAAFFTAGFAIRVVFFLVAVSVFFFAATARGAFFAALFFPGTTFSMKLHHNGYPGLIAGKTALLEHGWLLHIYVMDGAM